MYNINECNKNLCVKRRILQNFEKSEIVRLRHLDFISVYCCYTLFYSFYLEI